MRAEIEPASSKNRLDILPLNYRKSAWIQRTRDQVFNFILRVSHSLVTSLHVGQSSWNSIVEIVRY